MIQLRKGFAVKREFEENKGNRFGGSKASLTPISVGEEYIVTIETMETQGVGVTNLRGVSILIKNANAGDKVRVRLTKFGPFFAVAQVFSRK